MPERDELQSELRRVADWLMEVEEQLARPKPPAEPVPPPRKAAERARAQGWLLGIPLLGGAAAFVRHHLGATVAVAATGVVLSLTPSLAPHVTELPEPPLIAAPGPPPLEPRPEPTPAPETDSPEDTAPDVEPPEPELGSTDPTDAVAAPAQTPPAVEPAPDSPPDTRNGNGRENPPRREPRDEPPPEPRNEPPPPGPDCSIIELKTDVVRACVLPQ